MVQERGEAKAKWCLRTLAGVTVQTFKSSTGDIPRLVDYIPNLIQYGCGWVPGVLLRGSVWSLPGNFAQAVLAVGWCYMVSQIYEQHVEPSSATPTSSAYYAGRRLTSSAEMVTPGPYLKIMTFGRSWCATLVAFVVGGFVSVNVARWSRKRGTYGLLCGKTREQLICAAAFLRAASPGNAAECERANKLRQVFGRYAVMAMELAIHKSRGMLDSEATRIWLQERNLLKDNEWEKMIPGDRHTTVYFWLLGLCDQAAREGLLGADANANHIYDSIKSARGAANDMMDLLPNAMPYAYVQIVTFLVKSHVLLCSTEFGMILGNAKHEPAFEDGVPIGFSILMLAVVWMVNAYMQGLVDLHIILHNPFQNDILGISHELIGGGIHKLSLELMNQSFCGLDLNAATMDDPHGMESYGSLPKEFRDVGLAKVAPFDDYVTCEDATRPTST